MPLILTSRDVIYTIPQNTVFTAIGISGELKEQVSNNDLFAMDKGFFLEEQSRWNDKVFVLKKKEKKNSMIFGGAVALLTLITVLLKKKK